MSAWVIGRLFSMCVNPSKQFYPFDEHTQSRRSDYQVPLALYPFEGRMKRGVTKCLGCKTCYLYHANDGQGQPPLTGKELLKSLRSKVKPHHREFLTSPMDAFLHSGVVCSIQQVNSTFPLKFNLITKLPKIALHSLLEHQSIWEEVDYHIQVVAIKDGLWNGETIVEDIGELVRTAKTTSARLDPFVPDFSKTEEFVELIERLEKVGVRHVTTGVYSLYKDQLRDLAQEYGLDVDPILIRRNYPDPNESKLRGIHVEEDVELEFVSRMRDTCDRVGVALAVWSSRESCRKFSTGHADADGCDLPTAEEIRARYRIIEEKRELDHERRKQVLDGIAAFRGLSANGRV